MKASQLKRIKYVPTYPNGSRVKTSSKVCIQVFVQKIEIEWSANAPASIGSYTYIAKQIICLAEMFS